MANVKESSKGLVLITTFIYHDVRNCSFFVVENLALIKICKVRLTLLKLRDLCNFRPT
jgi:hypothetical protein